MLEAAAQNQRTHNGKVFSNINFPLAHSTSSSRTQDFFKQCTSCFVSNNHFAVYMMFGFAAEMNFSKLVFEVLIGIWIADKSNTNVVF